MQEAKTYYNLADYGVSQTSLEQAGAPRVLCPSPVLPTPSSLPPSAGPPMPLPYDRTPLFFLNALAASQVFLDFAAEQDTDGTLPRVTEGPVSAVPARGSEPVYDRATSASFF